MSGGNGASAGVVDDLRSSGSFRKSLPEQSEEEKLALPRKLSGWVVASTAECCKFGLWAMGTAKYNAAAPAGLSA